MPTSGDPIFEVLGSHTYHEDGTFTVNISVTTLGGVTTALTPGTATVADAALSSSNGTEITGIEGISTGTVVLGTFHDANPFATTADFTATLPIGGWGDGTPTVATTLTVTQVSPPATPGTTADSVFEITGSHIYKEEGIYAITINVLDVGGSATVISDSAIIADAPLTASATQPTVSQDEPTIFPLPVFAPPAFSGPVASFTDANPAADGFVDDRRLHGHHRLGRWYPDRPPA